TLWTRSAGEASAARPSSSPTSVPALSVPSRPTPSSTTSRSGPASSRARTKRRASTVRSPDLPRFMTGTVGAVANRATAAATPAGGTQESRAQLPRADEAGRPELAIAEANPLDGRRPGGPGRERGGDGAEPLLRVALAGARALGHSLGEGQRRGQGSGVDPTAQACGWPPLGHARPNPSPHPGLPRGEGVARVRGDCQLGPARDASPAVLAPLGAFRMVVDVAHGLEVAGAAVGAALDRAVGGEDAAHRAGQVLEEEALGEPRVEGVPGQRLAERPAAEVDGRIDPVLGQRRAPDVHPAAVGPAVHA